MSFDDLLHKPGIVTLVAGPMKSGKSRELINDVQRIEEYDKTRRVGTFKPLFEDRSGAYIEARVHHGEEPLKIPAILIDNPLELIDLAADFYNVFFDEAQLADWRLLIAVEELCRRGKNIRAYGLDQNAKGEKFGTLDHLDPPLPSAMPGLFSIAYEIRKTRAMCDLENCGEFGTRTQRFFDKKPSPYDAPVVIIGGDEERPFMWKDKKVYITYGVRCEKHHEVPGKPKLEDYQ